MEYLDGSSIPATKSDLDLFRVPATQTAIELSNEVGYRPIRSLDPSPMIKMNIPSSEHSTNFRLLYFLAKVKIDYTQKDAVETTSETSGAATTKVVKKIKPVFNFESSLFEQVNVFLETTNLTPGGNLYYYQVFLKDLPFKCPSKLDDLRLGIKKDRKRS